MAVNDRIGAVLVDWLRKGVPGYVRERLSDELERQANRLSAAQRSAFDNLQKPPTETGGIERSFRVVRQNQLHFEVLAGGPESTVKGYDHALGFEFGTVKQPARPFFYSTYRSMKKSMQDAVEETVTRETRRTFEEF